jgi:hypothetical protein
MRRNPRKARKLGLQISSYNKYHTIDKKKNVLTFTLIPTIVFEIDNTYKESLFIDDVQYGKFAVYSIYFEWLGGYIKYSYRREK